jgi:uncharacterized membrane protein YfcA
MLEVFLILFVLSFMSEYAAATLGMGYGTTLAPILIILGYEPLILVPVILFSQFFAGFIAAGFHHKFENMDLKDTKERTSITVFAVTGIFGVAISILVILSIPSFFVKLYIAIVVIIAGILTYMKVHHESDFSVGKIMFLGLVAAFNKGISGGGYGPISTAGQMMTGIKPRAAIAITALVEGIICAIGVLLYWSLAIPIDLLLLTAITTVGIIAAPLSAFTTKSLDQDRLKGVVSLAIILIGILSLIFVLIDPFG